jgi:hypothetical protein
MDADFRVARQPAAAACCCSSSSSDRRCPSTRTIATAPMIPTRMVLSFECVSSLRITMCNSLSTARASGSAPKSTVATACAREIATSTCHTTRRG